MKHVHRSGKFGLEAYALFAQYQQVLNYNIINIIHKSDIDFNLFVSITSCIHVFSKLHRYFQFKNKVLV